jgi:hypothetical protein
MFAKLDGLLSLGKVCQRNIYLLISVNSAYTHANRSINSDICGHIRTDTLQGDRTSCRYVPISKIKISKNQRAVD